MKRLFTYLVLATLLAFVVFKAGAWYQTKRLITEFQRATALHLAVSHGWIGSSLSGEVTIDDVVVTPFQLREPIPIGQVRISFPSLVDMLSYLSPFAFTEELSVPDALQIDLRQARVPLSQNWQAYAPEETPEGHFFGLACGDINDIGLEQLKQMGYTELLVDQTLGYELDRFNSELRLRFNTLIEGMSRDSGELVVAGVSWPPTEGMRLPRVKQVNYLHEDLSYMKRVMLLCGKNAGFNEPEFVEASLKKTQTQLAEMGITLNPQLTSAYRTYLKGDGVVEVSLRPAETIDLTTLPFLKPGELFDSLGFSLKLNRVAIPDAAFQVNMDQLTHYLFPPEPVVVVEPEPEPVVIPEPSFQPVEVEELELYLEQMARVTQTSGKVTEGVLANVEPYQITIGQQLQSGQVSFHIRKDDISEIQILR